MQTLAILVEKFAPPPAKKFESQRVNFAVGEQLFCSVNSICNDA